ncbi:sigma-70 family RNA polymerase sigma factor [Prevotella communis]|jgi:RNA polymerase sigma-70 factor (ECF subfamily)|uniref:RNA polymerase sigma-70 factor, ECF subfamily n=1 Tax=Prevotella communis TaxID=2913614 RepID=A0A1G7XZM4_9BACT|nr:sigma-70 family RNA polymerase sigma factor [Prevotella communis]UKK55450.1 sigma-70 family RNA polymerase sigma factor [Prevotella communis]UKK58266.1 sigma-70 family RNA polymerase sigma factor [Prevotella communis]SDG89682.1 RNA polymerase sigma-70 factor, ECF subfamily [Prevotella communis]
MKNFEGVSDEALALLYVKGDNRAFDELLSRTQTKLFTYIMFVVRDHDIADDIFQETFVKVITKLQQGLYTDSGKFQFWITRIAHNCIMDWYRQQQSTHIVDANEENDLQNLKNASVMDSNKEAEMINEQILIDIKKMMNTLPAPQREVVYMRYFQQLSFKEIADLTGVSINTSLGRMRYALINLRKMAKDNKIELALCEY